MKATVAPKTEIEEYREWFKTIRALTYGDFLCHAPQQPLSI